MTVSQEPEVAFDAAAGTGPHRAITLIADACTSCMICARECPSWCIDITSHVESVADLPQGARSRTENVLDRFVIDWSLCMFCGICITECPFDALEWSSDLLAAGAGAVDLRHGIDQLTQA